MSPLPGTFAEPTRHHISDDEALHWLALRLVPGLGTRRSVQLIDAMRTPHAIFRASKSELMARGVSAAIAQTIASGCTFEDAVAQQERMKETGALLVPITSPEYPERLRSIYDPPPVLFVRGRVELLQSLMIGVVGTRRPTTYGKAAAERLSADLAAAGLTIASGMARGIDTCAHKAALSAGGTTVAVFGCGVDTIYPAENRKLAEEIVDRGLLLSEFPMRSPAYPQNFPVRNRIVSGMSVGILVVEGAQYSGSSITARLAVDQGREVFAVPGNITERMSWGPNLLIKQGAAKLVQEWNDVVEELHPDLRSSLAMEGRAATILGASTGDPQPPLLPAGPTGETCRAILAMLKVDSAVQLDTLVESCDVYSSSEIIAALFELEMLGLIKQLPGKNFVKVWSGNSRP
jgi:DNA processing protein